MTLCAFLLMKLATQAAWTLSTPGADAVLVDERELGAVATRTLQ